MSGKYKNLKFALVAARMLLKYSKLSAKQVVEESLNEAADICIYTNPWFLAKFD